MVERSEQAADLARRAAASQSVTDTLAGPGVLLSLGQVISEMRLTPEGAFPDATFEWAGCPDGCTSLSTREVFALIAGDLVSSSTSISSDRITGPGASASDPRGDALMGLPAVVSYREDPAAQRWRTWYVIFDPDGGVVAVLAESGAL